MAAIKQTETNKVAKTEVEVAPRGGGGRPVALIDAETFAELAGVTPATVRRWALKGFPGATKVPGARGRDKVMFEKRIAAPFAARVTKLNETFQVVGR